MHTQDYGSDAQKEYEVARHALFYTDPDSMRMYKDHVAFMINRTNTVNGCVAHGCSLAGWRAWAGLLLLRMRMQSALTAAPGWGACLCHAHTLPSCLPLLGRPMCLTPPTLGRMHPQAQVPRRPHHPVVELDE